MASTRERVREYVEANPGSTYRDIMAGCGLSSTSQVTHHLRKLEYEGVNPKHLIEENARLKRVIAKLEKRLAAILEIAENE